MTEGQAKRLGQEARRELPVMIEAFNIVRAGIFQRLTETPVDQQATILGEHAKLHLLMELDQAISSIIVNGDHAALSDTLPGQ